MSNGMGINRKFQMGMAAKLLSKMGGIQNTPTFTGARINYRTANETAYSLDVAVETEEAKKNLMEKLQQTNTRFHQLGAKQMYIKVSGLSKWTSTEQATEILTEIGGSIKNVREIRQ